jgi:hypothetical protein
MLAFRGKGELLQVVVELMALEGRKRRYASREGNTGCALFDTVELGACAPRRRAAQLRAAGMPDVRLPGEG